ncbi:MAG: hypothetical protein MUO76_20095 [Anaerolineaceae bacterium]|nr:hypothetical protein [Anaerolineaceae bacterium]
MYKGIPISYPASIKSIGKASVTVRTGKNQLVCLYREKETYIQNISFPHLIKASVLLLDYDKLETMLSRFEYAPAGIGDRTQVRVQPKEHIKSLLQAAGLKSGIRGELADISKEGAAVFIDEQLQTKNACKIGDVIEIHLRLPKPGRPGPLQTVFSPPPTRKSLGEKAEQKIMEDLIDGIETAPLQAQVDETQDHVLKLNGNIANIKTGMPDGRCRIGVQLIPTTSRIVISRFLSERQAELIREIRALYDLVSLDINESMV